MMGNRKAGLILVMLLLGALACTIPIPSFSPAEAPARVAPPTAIPVATDAARSREPAEFPAALPLEANLVELYQTARQGVVSIWTFADLGPPHDPTTPSGQGSGFVIDMDGHIVTNQHVVLGADRVEVDFATGHKAWATLLGVDPDSDLAVLQVEVPAEILSPLPLGDSDQIQVGEFVVAIGNPFGLSGSMTVGVVSAIGRVLESERAAPGGAFFSAGDLIQTDAAINPGNSGGPLLNLRGQVVGINRAIRTENFTETGAASNSGVGFAVPINIVRRVAPSLIETGSYDYPYLGISSLDDEQLNLPLLEQLGLPADATGAYVTCVVDGGPADSAGLRGGGPCNQPLSEGGDLIVAIDGLTVHTFSDLLSHLISDTTVGDEVTLTVLRDGREIDITVTLEPRP